MRYSILLALVLLPTAGLAQWRYDPAQSAATAYCAARQNGRSHQQAEGAARSAVANAVGGSFGTQLGGILTGGRQAMQSAGYLAQQMCPEWFGATVSNGQYSLPSSYTLPSDKATFCQAMGNMVADCRE